MCQSWSRAQVYLPMSYVYGARGTGKLTPLVRALRQELYPRPYAGIDWNSARNQCAHAPLPHSLLLACPASGGQPAI